MKASITMMLSFKIPLIFLLPEQLFAGSSSLNILNCITSSQINGLSKYPNITWNCIPSRKKMSMHILCQKKILLYELEEISKPISHLDMLFLQPRCYLLYPLEKFTIFEPLNCKNRELNTKEGKEILLVWIVMNLENDRWKICMQISEENHLSF